MAGPASPTPPTADPTALPAGAGGAAAVATAGAGPEAAVWGADVSFGYRGRRALDGVGFAVPPGSIFGFLGPNGSGKTTLFRLLATLLPMGGGRLVVAGRDVGSEPRRVREVLGVAFQSPSLDLRLTVEENLRHHGHLYGLSGRGLARRIGDQVERFGVADRRRDRTETLSGGLRRRVELAKALLHEPPVLLLDEPSTGLDPRARRELWGVLEGLAGDGVTVLLTTHFIEEAEGCHHLVLLDQGRVVAAGTPRELTAGVGGEVVTLATAEPGGLAADLETVLADLGHPARAEVGSGELRFELDGGRGGTAAAGGAGETAAGETGAEPTDTLAAWELIARLARRLPAWEERVTAVTVARPTLEDVFLHRTGRRLVEAEADATARDAEIVPPLGETPAGDGGEDRP